MVVVSARSLIQRQVTLISVIVIMLDVGDVIDIDCLLYAPADRGFATARATRHANHKRCLPRTHSSYPSESVLSILACPRRGTVSCCRSLLARSPGSRTLTCCSLY